MTNDRIATIAVTVSMALLAAAAVAFAASGGAEVAPRPEDLPEIATTQPIDADGTTADLWERQYTGAAAAATSPSWNALPPSNDLPGSPGSDDEVDAKTGDSASTGPSAGTGSGPVLEPTEDSEHEVVTPPVHESEEPDEPDEVDEVDDPTPPKPPEPSDEHPEQPED
jgi:hypothetical protein